MLDNSCHVYARAMNSALKSSATENVIYPQLCLCVCRQGLQCSTVVRKLCDAYKMLCNGNIVTGEGPNKWKTMQHKTRKKDQADNKRKRK